MNYTEKKINEIIDLVKPNCRFWSARLSGDIELKIKEIIRDTRHKCAESIMSDTNNYPNPDYPYLTKSRAHDIVMNTNLDNH